MKWLTTFLAFYLLGLSLWPCADDTPPTSGPGNYVVLTNAPVPQSGSTHEHHDQCTPFCSCTCCAATISITPNFSYALAHSVEITGIAAVAFPYVSLHWADPLSAIWQPPKLRV
ncbi:DUF6660 family protein [Spirosoma agri]|uniref:DUF2946 domain-containing protein n=1 Tax=Spirosoma agri TaxID=1987381 RepID=A0A6M0II06_9BACT|nr:DUF6660 family protein [Spirosoma agri]NEU67492.1 hypothetical protein [Spirosoma agri]